MGKEDFGTKFLFFNVVAQISVYKQELSSLQFYVYYEWGK